MTIFSKNLRKVVLGVVALVPCAPSLGENLLSNSGFEDGLAGWNWSTAGGGQGTGKVDAGVGHKGRAAFKITYASAPKGNRYGRLSRTVPIKPLRKYRITAWCRGRSVGHVWIGGGPGWRLRRVLPKGAYEWRKVSVDYTSGDQQTSFYLMAAVESPTEAVWLDDIRMVELGRVGGRVITA